MTADSDKLSKHSRAQQRFHKRCAFGSPSPRERGPGGEVHAEDCLRPGLETAPVDETPPSVDENEDSLPDTG